MPDDTGTPAPDRPVGRGDQDNNDGEGDEEDEGDDDDEDGEGDNGGDEDSDDGEEENITYDHDGRTFEEVMKADIDLILKFAKGLKYQVQFQDQRMLNTLKREGASFLRLARACMEKEKARNSTRGRNVSTWDKSTSSAMFYHTRPIAADEGT